MTETGRSAEGGDAAGQDGVCASEAMASGAGSTAGDPAPVSHIAILQAQADEGDDEAEDLPKARPRERSVKSLLAEAAFARAAGPALLRRLKTPRDGVCICIGIPDPSWEGPLREMAAEAVRPIRLSYRDIKIRSHSDTESMDASVRWLQGGASVLWVSQDVTAGVPSEIRSVADATLRLDTPPPDAIMAVIAIVGRRGRSRKVPADLGRGLSLSEVAACLRYDEPTRRTVARLQRVQRTKRATAVDTDGPSLDQLAGYGLASGWAARLRDGLEEYHAGRVSWRRLDARMVLYGPPGTGKSLFAPALARTLGVGCIRTSVGRWFSTHGGDLGQTVKAATAVFEQAREAARTHGAVVLFIDELDGLPDRGELGAREGSWWRPVVNWVLAALDGGDTDLEGVILVAATNDLDAVDPALLRPGRLGRHFHIGPPGLEDLVSILVHHLGGVDCPIPRADLVGVMRPLVGATQARAASWAGEALRRASRQGRGVSLADIVAVALPADGRTERERRRVAIHEAGHAVAGLLLAGGRLVSASLLQMPTSNGETRIGTRDEALLLRDEIEEGIIVLLAGRAADNVLGDGPSSSAGGIGVGASMSDLAQATSRLTAVHASYGLGRTLRHRGDPLRPDSLRGDREVARLVEEDLRRLMARAENFVRERGDAVRAVAEALLARTYLDADDVGRILACDAGGPPPAA